MKKLLILMIVVATAVLTGSCTSDHSEPDGPDTRALMTVEVLTRGTITDDYIYTARFIVFDNASSLAELDINKVITLDEDDRDATVFKTTLEVKGNRDKMLVVILNEPAVLAVHLNGVGSPTELEDIVFRMADAFNFNHTAPLSTGLPMTGVTRGIAVTDENKTENEAAQVSVTVKRAVARVELLLKTDGQTDAQVTTSTSVTLVRTHSEGYLMGPDPDNGLGRMMTVANPSAQVVWTYTGPDPLQLTGTRQFICAFYTPERTCSELNDADKLVLKVQNISTPDGIKNAETSLSEFTPESGPAQTITRIARNNVYRIVGRVDKMEFDHSVLPWSDAEQGIIIDPQYFLRVSGDDFYMPDNGDRATITAQTNYDRDDRGFSKGIQQGQTRYYDPNGDPVTGSGDPLNGWLDVSLTGADGDLSRIIDFLVTTPAGSVQKGCYATVEVKGGNLIKLVRVTR